MFNSQILDVAIGLLLMFLFQSILISGIHDLLVSMLAVRGKILKTFLITALKTKETKDTIFEQMSSSPFINNLKRKNRFPSEITSRNFSDAIIELIIREDASKDNYITQIKNNIAKLPDSEFKSILIARLNESGDSYENFKASIEKWFDDYMDRISRWYKKRVTYFMYMFAFGSTLALNVDALFVMNELWKNPKLRESAVVMSENIVQKDYNEITKKKYTGILTDSSNTKDSINVALDKVTDSYQNLHLLDFPITWAYAYQLQNSNEMPLESLTLMEKLSWTIKQITIEKLLGFIITTLAVSIGAPIWYDLIKKLVSAREMLKKK
jgi:hypothetical protein